jgi:hypothetical protein
MKPNKTELATAVGHLSMLKYFPGSDIAQQAIMQLLERMVGTREQLSWLVRTMIDRVGEWQGPSEMRGLFCTQFKPADGEESNCTLAGYSPADLEARLIEQHQQLKTGRAALQIVGSGKQISPEELEKFKQNYSLVLRNFQT